MEKSESNVESAKAYLDIKEVERLEKAATNLRDRLLNRMLFRSGGRVSEIVPIAVEDIDFAEGTVRIQHLKTRIKLSCKACGARLSRRHVFCPQCGQKVVDRVLGEMQHRRMRVLPLDKETLRMLKRFIKRGGPVLRDGKLLIFGINRHRAWQIVKGCAEKAGLPKLVNPETGRVHNVSPHRLRDAFAIHSMKRDDSGDALRLLQQHLGHQNFNTTARYRKVSGKEQQEWYQKLWLKNNTKSMPK